MKKEIKLCRVIKETKSILNQLLSISSELTQINECIPEKEIETLTNTVFGY